jgi:hypothetical protein
MSTYDIETAMTLCDGTEEKLVTPDVFLDPIAPDAHKIVVCDGSVYDQTKPHLLITLGNHTVKPLEGQTEELGFDATSGRMFSTVSMHDRCGVIVSTEKHASALQGLGYPVVAWGQTIAFPMCPKAIKKMNVGKYLGAVVVHTFTESARCHNTLNKDTGKISGDGTFDGCNHLAGAYIPTALALEGATRGATLVNCETVHSGLKLQAHTVKMIVAFNDEGVTSIVCKDKTGGSIIPDDKHIMCAGAVVDTHPLVISCKQIKPGFDQLVQEMSGSATSYTTKLGSQISTNIGGGIFQQYDKRLEADIRTFASNRTQVGTNSVSIDKQIQPKNQTIEMCNLSEILQKRFVTTAMVAMEQPMSIGAPIVITSKTDSTGKDTTKADGQAEAKLYGDTFSTRSYTLEASQKLKPGETVHPYFGIVAVSHALFQAQIPSQKAYDICASYADHDSPYLDCTNASCECNIKKSTDIIMSSGNPISSRFENMMQGVSQNIALSTNLKIGKDAAAAGKMKEDIPKIKLSKQPELSNQIECKAGTSFCGTCKCDQCVGHSNLLSLAQRVASATHAYQKCDNYVPDQTMCAVDVNGIPKYKSTESMMPFGTAMKAIMMKCGPSEDDHVQVRVGMNTDDCENCAFESKAVLDTLTLGSQAISREYFHGSKDATAYSPLADTEKIRSMRLGNLSKQEQRHILLVGHVLGKTVDSNLAYFVTGSPTKANDVTTTKSALVSDLHTTVDCNSVFKTPGMAADLSSVVGVGLQAFGSKPSGYRIGRDQTTDAGEDSGLSGHCTCILSITRKDGLMHSVPVEGTAPLRLAPCNIPAVVQHRGSLTSKINDDTKVLGASGVWKGAFTVDNAVDVSLCALPSSHVATISNRLQVDGSTMRAEEIMGYDMNIQKNCSQFYNTAVSSGSLQLVQTNGSGGIQPGADVKTLINQKVLPRIDSKTAARGEKYVVAKMGNATCAYVEAFDNNTDEYKDFEKMHDRFRSTMSPLRLSIEIQDKHMLNSMGSLSSLGVNFPDDAKLMKSHGPFSYVGFVTHVPLDDSVEGHLKIFKSIENHAKNMNSEYVNVRVAQPVIVGSGEILTHYKVYGMTDGL